MKESQMKEADASYRAEIGAGDYWWKEIKKGEVFRILDIEGNQAADTLFFSAADHSERYSASDTIKKQSGVYLRAGTELISNRGNCLLKITADTCGRQKSQCMLAETALSEESRRWVVIRLT